MNDSLAIKTNEPATGSASAADVGDHYEAFKKFLAEEDDGPTPGFAFSNRHCKTEEEADAALEAFLREELGLTDEDD